MKGLIEALLNLLKAIFGGSKKSLYQPSKLKDIDTIKVWEGLRLRAYQDTGGVWTIGYGHTKTAKPGMVISEQEAESLLREDIAWVEDVLNTTIEVPVSQKQYDALGSFVYNIGGTQWRSSTLLKKLNQKDYVGAAKEFPKWKYDNGRVIQGLLNRRIHEQQLFIEGMRKKQHTAMST